MKIDIALVHPSTLPSARLLELALGTMSQSSIKLFVDKDASDSACAHRHEFACIVVVNEDSRSEELAQRWHKAYPDVPMLVVTCVDKPSGFVEALGVERLVLTEWPDRAYESDRLVSFVNRARSSNTTLAGC